MKLVAEQSPVLIPDDLDECGAIYWLAEHFAGKKVVLEFSTREHERIKNRPMLWIKEAK